MQFHFIDVEIPKDRQKLRVMLKVPNFNNTRAPKLQKKIGLMRGPEMDHNTQLVYKQYGLAAMQGGRIEFKHIEHIRLQIAHKLDASRMFAIWRIPEVWQPLTKKGIGQRMGAGKGPVDRYVTPIRGGRVIMEIGGKCSFAEVKRILDHCARILPFKARAVTQKLLDEEKIRQEWLKTNNQNYFTKQYIIQNNVNGCHRWLRPADHLHFCEYE